MVKKFKGYIKELEFSDIKKELTHIPEFVDFNKWKIKKLEVGEMHHTYVFSKGDKKHFIKEVKPHEAQVNYFLCKLNLKHLTYAVYPELLKKSILVMPYIKGKMLKERKISLKLLKDFVTFQNKMNDKAYFDKNNFLKLDNYSQKDDGFFKNGVMKNLVMGKSNLLILKKKYNLSIIDKFLDIINKLEKDKEKIAEEFSRMPYARQHHDFREDNILVNDKDQFLIDWGSSYGYGPFMYDYSKFLVYNNKAFNLVMNNSDMCKKATKEQVKQWLYVALVAKMLNMLTYYIPSGHHNIETREKAKKFLEYEYKTYSYLID